MRRFSRRDFLAGAIAAAVASAGRHPPAVARPYAPAICYEGQRRFEILHRGWLRNGDLALTSLELWIPVPQDDHQQSLHGLKIQPRVPLVRAANGLARVARYYSTRDLPTAGEIASLEVSYQITVRTVVPDWNLIEQYGSLPYREDRAYRLFTQPETKIESAHPKIIQQANRFLKDAKTPLAIAQAAYRWVLENIQYRSMDGFRGALYCLENGRGECGDYSALFAALCRAAGVPARSIAGFWADKTNDWHCWAEFMLPTGDWVPVDATMGDRGRSSRQYYFGSLENRRVALCHAADVELVGPRAGHHRRDCLQNGACWWEGSIVRPDPQMPKAQFQVTGREIEPQESE